MKTLRQFLRLAACLTALGALAIRAQVPGLLNFQGHVLTDGTPFQGGGLFKFALVNGTGTITHWSNDGTSANGSQPAAAVALAVTQGNYAVLLGDDALPNMTAVPAGVFANGDVRLRVWFNDGTHGFQQLGPDQRVAAVGYAMAANVPDGAITAGKLDATLNASLARLNSSPTFTGTVTASGFSGSGAGLTQLDAAQLAGSLDASLLTGSIDALRLGGTLDDARLFPNIPRLNSTGSTFAGVVYAQAFQGDGAGLVNLNAGALQGVVDDIHLSGNVAKLSSSATFTGNVGAPGFISSSFGTTDNRAVQFNVNNQVVLRLEPAPGGVNVIGGYSANGVGSDVRYATIGGGGFFVAGYENRIDSGGDGSTIAGGAGNVSSGEFSAIGGGVGNHISARNATVAGGDQNKASGIETAVGGGELNEASGAHATVAGGRLNHAEGDSATVAGGVSNRSGGPLSAIGGGEVNRALGSNGAIGGGFINLIETNTYYGTIGGGRANRILADVFDGTIGGGQGNLVSGGRGAIAGGENNRVWAEAAFVGGGAYNEASGWWATIAGGTNNVIGTNVQGASIVGGLHNGVFADAAIIGGGSSHTIRSGATNSVIGGGLGNLVAEDAQRGVIAGGSLNVIGSGAANGALGGGASNRIGKRSHQSVLGGGLNNEIADDSLRAVIAGGGDNLIETNAPGSVVSGGERNHIQAGSDHSVIAGGSDNRIGESAPYAFIAGGCSNRVLGAYGFAGGFRARADHEGSFVWADASGGTLTSARTNQFRVRASGGVGIYTDPDENTGVSLAPGDSSWNTVSDRNVKKDFAAVKPREVLEKLAKVPVQHWRYQWETDGSTPHLGPMAQDFKAAFYPGRDDKKISTLEFDGVELAAIQGLNEKLETETKAKDQRIQQLEGRLADLEKMVRSLATQRAAGE